MMHNQGFTLQPLSRKTPTFRLGAIASIALPPSINKAHRISLHGLAL